MVKKIKNIVIAIFCAWMLQELKFDVYVLGLINNMFYINLDINDYYLGAIIIGYAQK